MIAGIGTDLITVERMARVWQRHGERLCAHILSPEERHEFADVKDPARWLAKRWAAKEACSKALGTGLRMGIAWKDMAVSNLHTGQPVMHVTGWAAERLSQMTPPGHSAVIHVTLTDDHPWASAFVVIEARPVAA